MKSFFKLIGALIISSSFAVSANEAALYAPQVEADEALIRVLNLSEHRLSMVISSLNKEIKNTASLRFSHYIRAEAGRLVLQLNQASIEVDAKAGSRYTLVYKPDSSLQVIEDISKFSKGKSMLALYNFSSYAELTLSTANGKIEIIPDVAPDSVGYRELNAVGLNMGIFDGKVKIKETQKLQLQQDKVHNIAVIDSKNGIAFTIMTSNTNTRI